MSNSQTIDDQTKSIVLKALENPSYVWRTVAGLKNETNLSQRDVLRALREIPKDNLVVSYKSDGKKVYSTREHYRKTQSLAGKILGAIANRAI